MSLYGRIMHWRERVLTQRDTHRKVYPFEWGLEWLGMEGNGRPPLQVLLDLAQDSLSDSEAFFALPEEHVRGRWAKRGDHLEFESPADCLLEQNNRVRCRVFEAPASRRAVVVLPQWNADEESHVGLCRVLSKLGITAVRHALPFHEHRRPQGMVRADYMVSPNIGRTIHAVRQAVLETRRLVHLLGEKGYRHIGVMGTSIGSCVGYLSFLHEPLLKTGVFNFVSGWFADVVWQGNATRYVRRGLEGRVSLEDLRRCWAPISPMAYVQRAAADRRRHLLISARYDLTFLPEMSEEVFKAYRRYGGRPEVAYLPCGHYTTARFPFKYLDGWHICRYLRRHL
ncbi:MAG TPA: hypothetical protein VLU25_20620 [Acidobacteriota bacterium]|nr:hypothetical protein [Acidobacteriota bacterium]